MRGRVLSSLSLLAILVACGPEMISAVDEAGGSNSSFEEPRCEDREKPCWMDRFGTREHDAAAGIAVDHGNNVYVVGHTDGGLDGMSRAQAQDGFVAKYCAAGTRVWTVQFGGEDVDGAYAVAVDSAGAAYIVGSSPGFEGFSPIGPSKGLIAKYGSAGDLLWRVELAADENTVAEDIIVAPDGEIYISGRTEGTLDGATMFGDYDAFVARYRPSGSLDWVVQFGSDGRDDPSGLSFDGSGSIYVSGVTNGEFPGNVHAGGRDIFLSKLSTQGSLVWSRQLGTSADDGASDLVIDGDGIYITGFVGYDEALDGNVTAGKDDVFVASFNDSGERRWTTQFGSSERDSASTMALGADRLLHIFGRGGASLVADPPVEGERPFVASYDLQGDLVSIRPVDGFGFVADISVKDYSWFIAGSVGGADVAVARLCQ